MIAVTGQMRTGVRPDQQRAATSQSFSAVSGDVFRRRGNVTRRRIVKTERMNWDAVSILILFMGGVVSILGVRGAGLRSEVGFRGRWGLRSRTRRCCVTSKCMAAIARSYRKALLRQKAAFPQC